MRAFKPKELNDFLENYMLSMIKDLNRPVKWYHEPSDKTRTLSYAGINNLGNICYMNSIMQQFFMVPQFRYLIFKAIDTSPEELVEHEE